MSNAKFKCNALHLDFRIRQIFLMHVSAQGLVAFLRLGFQNEVSSITCTF